MPDRMCPKCGFAQPDSNEECAQCGVVFERYHQQRDALLKKTSARKGPAPPPPPKRVRPLTYVMFAVFVALAAWQLQRMDFVRNPPSTLAGDDNVSRGGTIDVRKRGRVETAAPAGDEEWDGELRFGLKVFPGARLLGEAEIADPDDPAEQVARFEASAPFDEVMAFYEAELGWARAKEQMVSPPEGIAVGADQQGVVGKRARWYALTSDAEGNSAKVDVTLQAPFYDPDGTFHPETTLIALSLLR